MRGFGEPSEQVEILVFGDKTTARPYPWGFGDPYSGSGIDLQAQPDLGFGDVMPEANLGVLLVPTRDLPDDGGLIIEISGDWPDLGAQKGEAGAGPFQIRLRDASTGIAYPKETVGCHGGRIGSGTRCFTDVRHEVLSFVLPPLPLSVFSIEIRYGDGFRTLITIPDAFRVVHRSRASEIYGGRANLSTRFETGPRLSDLETLRGQ